MTFPRTSFRSFFLIVLLTNFSLVLSAQIKGGYESGQTTPAEVKAGSINVGGVSGDVNLFTGTYSTSQTLGTVSCPSGLSYTQTMSYSSTHTTGDNLPQTSGIPYGEGWNMDLPMITVSTEDYTKYTQAEIYQLSLPGGISGESTEERIYTPTFTGSNCQEVVEEGRLYWFAPTLSIPGVASGRMVHKGYEGGVHIFVLRKFERYIEAHLQGHTWTVILDDGTQYTFITTKMTHRNASNQRVQTDCYGLSRLDTVRNDDGEIVNIINVPSSAGIANLVLPKTEIMSWHCNYIFNPNKVGRINFEYEAHGRIDFYKNLSDPFTARAIDAYFRPGGASSPGLLTPARDLYLKEINSCGAEKLTFNHRSISTSGAENLVDLNDLQPGEERFDSLYTKQVVANWGGAGGNFNGWKRFNHASKEGNAPNYYPSPNGSSNPYLVNNVGTPNDFYLVDEIAASQNSIPFDHSFLESGRIGADLPSGDLYEIEGTINSNISGTNLSTFDINIATGTLGNGEGLVPDGDLILKDFYDAHRYETIFSTFGQAIKPYNNITDDATIKISNVFMMPNLPVEYQGFNVQIGPGNSDNNFIYDFCATSAAQGPHPPTCRSYWHSQPEFSELDNDQSGDPIPNSFGIGMPWDLVKGYYASIDQGGVGPGGITYDGEYCHIRGSIVGTWFNNGLSSGSTAGCAIPNIPTKADQDVVLSDLKLIRYVKNPYMLTSVKKFIVHYENIPTGGSIPDPDAGWQKVNHLQFDYDVTQVDLYAQTKHWEENDQIISTILKEQKRNIFRLRKIIQMTQDEIDADLSDNPTTFLTYELSDIADYTIPNINPIYPSNTSYPMEAAKLVSNNALLKKIVSPIGGITEINYKPIELNGSYTTNNFTIRELIKKVPPQVGIARISRGPSFGVQIFHVVDNISREDHSDTQTTSYSFSDLSGLSNVNIPVLNERFRKDFVHDYQLGFERVNVDGPFQNGQSTLQRYKHYINDFYWGKLKRVQSFDGAGNPISVSESIYEHSVAFEPAMHRIARTFGNGQGESDYCDYAVLEEKGNLNCNIMPPFTPRPKIDAFATIEEYNDAIRTYIEEYGMPEGWINNRPQMDDYPSNNDRIEFTRAYIDWLNSRPVRLVKNSPDFYGGSGTYDAPTFYETNHYYWLQKLNPTYAYSFFIKKVKDTQKTYDNLCQEEGNFTCSGGGTLNDNFIEQITDYKYYEADYSGEILEGNPYNIVKKWHEGQLRLSKEPSWQLYATKSYSPQLPGAETLNENFYLYDLLNNNEYHVNDSNQGPNNETFSLLATADRTHSRNLLIESRTTNKYPNSDDITKSVYLTYLTDFIANRSEDIDVGTIYSDEWPCETIEPIIEVPSEPSQPGDPSIPDILEVPWITENNIYLSKVRTQVGVWPTDHNLRSTFELVNNEYEHKIFLNHITNVEILERNIYGQVSKEINERGIITKYDYNDVYTRTYKTCSNGEEITKTFHFRNYVGLPMAVTVGYDRDDELRSEYTYHPNNNVASLTDPNGTMVSYTYDEFGRLNNTLRNGDLLTTNFYSNWKNNNDLTFKERVDQNVLGTITYVDPHYPFFFQKAHIDPLGRSVASLKIAPGNASIGIEDNIFDIYGRPVVKLRPDAGAPSVTEEGIERDDHLEIEYDVPGRDRPIKSAKFGESINGAHVVTNDYAIVDANTLRDNLLATGQEEMPPGSKFYYTSTTDEDGKTVREFKNALGQTVATITNNGEYGTLFFYNAHGSVKKVYSPMKKISEYKYNYLGQLYEKDSPDIGKDEYAYDHSGLLIGEKQENKAIRAYTYDDYGRQLTQVALKSPGNLFNNQGNQWILEENQSLDYFTSIFTNPSKFFMSKKMVYGNWDPADEELFSFNLSANLNEIENAIGRVVETVSYDKAGLPIEMKFFSYNNDGFLDWEVLIGNFAGLKFGSNNQVTRITYPEYNLMGAVKRMNVSFRFQGGYEFTYRNEYDYFGRIEDVYVRYGGLHNGNESRIVNYEYDDIVGAVKRKKYYDSAQPLDGEELPPECQNYEIDNIGYGFDKRFRMTSIGSESFIWGMDYDDPAAQGFIGNYNGNINQTIGVYNVDLFEEDIPLFNGQTTYDYRYDQVNRLTIADATLTVDPDLVIGNLPLLGDVEYNFNKDGDFTNLLRGELNQQNQSAEYIPYIYYYINGTSKLEKITTTGSADRTFKFDESGNLLKDTGKGIIDIKYTRANLPFAIASSRGGGNYRYNTADERIYKTGSQGVEYYVRNALGQELVIRNSRGEATWYVFGNERVAKIPDPRPFNFDGNTPTTTATPESCDTPPLNCNEETIREQQNSLNEIKESSTPTTRLEKTVFPTTLRRVRLCDGTERYLFEDEIESLVEPFHLLQVIEIYGPQQTLAVNFGENGLEVLNLDRFIKVRWRFGNELTIGEFSGCPIDEACELETFKCTKKDIENQAKDRALIQSLVKNRNIDQIKYPTYLYMLGLCNSDQRYYLLSSELQQLSARYQILQQVEITHPEQQFNVQINGITISANLHEILNIPSDEIYVIEGSGCELEYTEIIDKCRYRLSDNRDYQVVFPEDGHDYHLTYNYDLTAECRKETMTFSGRRNFSAPYFQYEVEDADFFNGSGLKPGGSINEFIITAAVKQSNGAYNTFNKTINLSNVIYLGDIYDFTNRATEAMRDQISQWNVPGWIGTITENHYTAYISYNASTHKFVIHFKWRHHPLGIWISVDPSSANGTYISQKGAKPVGLNQKTYFPTVDFYVGKNIHNDFNCRLQINYRISNIIDRDRSTFYELVASNDIQVTRFPDNRFRTSVLDIDKRIITENIVNCNIPIGIWNGKEFSSCNYTFTSPPENNPQPPTFIPEPEPVPAIIPDISYYIHDHLGNTRIIYNTNRICGEEELTYHAEYLADYYPYGKILREYTVGQQERYLTTHHERDQETGLDYRGARFYDSDIGRFLSVDPLAADYANWSPYNYVLGNPVRYVDPDGRKADDIIISHNGEDYTYKNGKLFSDGIEFTGKQKGFLKKVVKTLNTIGSTISGGELLDELESSVNVFTIKEGAREFKSSDHHRAFATQFKNDPKAKKDYDRKIKEGFDFSGGSGGVIEWNSSGADLATTSGVRSSPVSDLAHELFHGLDANRGLLDSRDHKGATRTEWQAVYRENLLRDELKKTPLRTHYNSAVNPSGEVTGGTGPRMLTPNNKPLKPTWYE